MTDRVIMQFRGDFELAKDGIFCTSITETRAVAFVQTHCPLLSRKIASDVVTAFEYGAAPAARDVIIEQLEQANMEQRPFACSLEHHL